MCKVLETVIVPKTLSFTQLTGRSAGEYLFHISCCGSFILYCIMLEMFRIFSSPLNYVAIIRRSVNFMREYRNFSCHQYAAVGSDAGAAVVRARGWPRSSRMWRQILPIWSAAVKTACVSYAVPDSSYISVWLVSAVLWTLARRSCCPWRRPPRNRSPSLLLQPILSSPSQPETRKDLLPVRGCEHFYQHITFRNFLSVLL